MILAHRRVRSGTPPRAASRTVAGLATAAVLGGLLVPVVAGPAAVAAPVPAVTTAAGLPAVTQDVSALSPFDADLLRLINQARATAGVAPVQEARGLDRLSAWWSAQLATGTGTLAHNPTGLAMVTGYGATKRTRWAENVAKLSPASAVTAQSLFDTYLASPSHRANILNPKFAYVGVGSVATAAGISFNTVNFTDAVDAGQTFDPKAAATPVGQFQGLSFAGATVTVTGWGLDPDLGTGAATVRLTDTAADGAVTTTTTSAAATRPGLTGYPAAGAAHGFDRSWVTAGRGAHTVCATVVDNGTGLGDTALGCLGYTVGDPVGALESATVTGRTLTVAGWAVDPDQPTAGATVTVTDRIAGAAATSTVVATAPHPGSGDAVVGAGTAHGFTLSTPVTGVGEHTVCATVAGVRATTVSADLGCRTVTVTAAAPLGSLDTVTAPDRRSVSLAGWAADPDVPTTPSTVRVTVTNSAGSTTTTLDAAGQLGAEPGPGLGRAHGFAATLPLTADGTSTVCVRSVSRSTDTVGTDLGCRTVTVAWLHGWLDKVTPTTTSNGGRTLTVAGWAIDQGVPTSPVPVALKVTAPNGTVTTTTVTADALRADVGRAFPGTGDRHGYQATLKVAAAGTYQVCATEISPRNAALTKQLRCLPVTVG